MNTEILHQDIQTLLEFFAKNNYRADCSNFFVSEYKILQFIHRVSSQRK